jgi:hypothetical protein
MVAVSFVDVCTGPILRLQWLHALPLPEGSLRDPAGYGVQPAQVGDGVAHLHRQISPTHFMRRPLGRHRAVHTKGPAAATVSQTVTPDTK